MKPIGVDLGFQHEWGKDTKATLADKVDASGGWNPDAACVQFFHGIEDRHCIFSAHNMNTGWWTTVLTRDEYYWERIGPNKKAEIRREIIQAVKNACNNPRQRQG